MRTRSQSKNPPVDTGNPSDVVRSSSTKPQPSTGTTAKQRSSEKKAQSSSTQVPRTVTVNTLFFSSPGPDSSLCHPVSVPENLLDAPLAQCMDAFAKVLQDHYKVKLRCDYTFEFFAPKEKFLGRDCAKIDLPNDFRDSLRLQKFVPASSTTFLRELHYKALSYKPVNENDDIVVLGIKALEGDTNDNEESDTLSPLQCFHRLLRHPGQSPSAGAQSTAYAKMQSNPATTIYDGRRAFNKHETVAPPIYIYNSIFSRFYELVSEAPSQITEDFLLQTQEFMAMAAVIAPLEDGCKKMILGELERLLAVSIHIEQNRDLTTPDGVHVIVVRMIRVCLLILEIKKEMAEGGCDSTNQVSISFKRTWIPDEKTGVRNLCNCPTFLLAFGGPWLCVLGGVITKDVIVQRLTSMDWMVRSSTEDDVRVLQVASTLWALRECLKELAKFYERIVTDSSLPKELTNCHPRFYPTPTTFRFRERTITFSYMEPLQTFSTCLTFKAEITQVSDNHEDLPFKKGNHVVVKFVSRYGEEVHRHLADLGRAPKLYYFGEVSEWKGAAEAFAPPPNLKVKGLTGACSKMVVMEYIESSNLSELPTAELARQVAEILYHLHSKGFAFGDLRRPNVLLDRRRRRLKLIDFNWAGCFNPRDLATEEKSRGVPQLLLDKLRTVAWPSPKTPAQFPLNVCSETFNSKSLGLGRILPQHDWKMWRLHFCWETSSCDPDVILKELVE